jgi:hypothetical protein
MFNKRINHQRDNNVNRSKRSNNRTRQQKSSVVTSGSAISALYATRNLSFKPAQVFPNHYRTTLTYREQVNYTAVTTPQNYIFRGNSVFDPNQTGTGSQPVGFDNLSTFFESYYVIGSRMKVFLINQSTPVMQISISPTNATGMVTTYDQSLLYPHSKFLVVDGVTRGGKSMGSLTHQMSTLSFFDEPYDRDFLSLVTTNPSKQFYWAINFQTADQVTAITCNIQFTIDYDVIFQSRKFVALS